MEQKNNIVQLFCKHKNSDWYKKETKFHSLNGERKYKICNDCGKVIDRFFENSIDENYM